MDIHGICLGVEIRRFEDTPSLCDIAVLVVGRLRQGVLQRVDGGFVVGGLIGFHAHDQDSGVGGESGRGRIDGRRRSSL
jgi:hypothetical protein